MNKIIEEDLKSIEYYNDIYHNGILRKHFIDFEARLENHLVVEGESKEIVSLDGRVLYYHFWPLI